jgi:hypothetical protein
MMDDLKETSCNAVQYITEEDIKRIVNKYGYGDDDTTIEKYVVHNASDKMIGFMADYLKLQISVVSNDKRRLLCLFVKAVPINNAAKANMAVDFGSLEKEITFYDDIKRKITVPGDLFRSLFIKSGFSWSY